MCLSELEPFFTRLSATRLSAWRDPLQALTSERLQPARHGDLPAWLDVLRQLPEVPAAHVRLDAPCPSAHFDPPLDPAARARLRAALQRLHPWRKGPFCLAGITIDAEWRSDWKWSRLARAVAPLEGRLVLDVGCGNGYYGYRALGAGAELVLGIDPTSRFVLQSFALNRFFGADRAAVLPLADTDLPRLCAQAEPGLDTVLSMGVLYHRRDAKAHLRLLRRCLREGGELVLETLVMETAGEAVLVPDGRYAQMRNVHAIPSIAKLRAWLREAGYRGIQLADITPTTVAEQRTTSWMRFKSLADFLDPDDPARTLEGHPAPVRALALARR